MKLALSVILTIHLQFALPDRSAGEFRPEEELKPESIRAENLEQDKRKDKSPPPKTLEKESREKQTTPELWIKKLRYIEDKRVLRRNINGSIIWCQESPHWKISSVRVGIAAGSIFDPKGLSGRSRFLAAVVRSRLNRPENPAEGILPKGGVRYKVILDKEWLEIRSYISEKKLPEALSHIVDSIKRELTEEEIKKQREFLLKTSGKFPPPGLKENIESLLFGNQPRGKLLRGERRTFERLQLFALRESQRLLFVPSRIRILVLTENCKHPFKTLKPLLENWKTEGETQLPVFPKKSFVKNSVLSRIPNRREFFSLYLLPPLDRSDFAPLSAAFSVIQRELEYNFQKQYGEFFSIFSFLNPTHRNGYAVLITFSQPMMRERIESAMKKIIGRLQIKGYSPVLEQRVELFLAEVKREFLALDSSIEHRSEWLWRHLLLPAPKDKGAKKGLPSGPPQIEPLLDSISPKLFRDIALHYFGREVEFQPSEPPFSVQRIVFFVGMLFLLWLLLDLFFRKSRPQ